MATNESQIPSPIDTDERIEDPGDYKQHRRLRAIFDARDWVWTQREKAWDWYFRGDINRTTRDKALRMALEKYIGESMYKLRESQWSQWYWEGQPPTVSGEPSYRENEDGEFVLVAEHPDDIDGEAEDYDGLVLATNWKNEPVFGTDLNVLGQLEMPEVDRMMTFIGLESYMEVGDPIVRQASVTREHPMEIQKTETEVFRYQIPEDVTMQAFYLLNDFWARAGLAIAEDKGLPIEDDFDMSREDDGIEYGHAETPEV